jgi:Flp pilus assembly protein TadG
MYTRRDTGAAAVRKGMAAPWFVAAAPVLVLLAVMAVQVANLRHRQLELHTAVEAAALAGANALLDDSLLSEQPDGMAIDGRARAAAARYAAFNPVAGKPLDLDPNAQNFTDGELVLGTLDNPFNHAFDASGVGRLDRNAVRVAGQRHGVAASATAFVDRDVVGFKIQGLTSLPAPAGGQAIPSVPVFPLAIPAEDWDRAAGELEVTFGAGGSGRAVGVGVADAAGVARQVQTGLTYLDLAGTDFAGALLLDDGLKSDPPEQKNYRRLPLLELAPDGLEEIAAALRSQVGRPRVWMLYARGADRREDEVKVIGFAAGRVVGITAESGVLTVIIRPCELATGTAVTDYTRRDWGPRSLANRTVAKVRLVE